MNSRDLLRYEDRNGDSGVLAYQSGPNFIIVEFKSGGGYRYDYTTPGRRHVEAMKKLPESGDGLATYINQHIREHYAEKLW